MAKRAQINVHAAAAAAARTPAAARSSSNTQKQHAEAAAAALRGRCPGASNVILDLDVCMNNRVFVRVMYP